LTTGACDVNFVQIDPLVLLVATATFFIGGVLKGAMGFGLPLLAIPMVTVFGSLPLALSIAVPPVVATNLWQLWKFRAHRRLPFLRWFLILGAVGLFIGAFILKNIVNAYLEVLLGSLVLMYLLVRGSKVHAPLSGTLRDTLSPVIGGLAGVVHGTTGLSGLIGIPFFQAAGLARPAFIFSSNMMFTVFSLLHLTALSIFGLYQTSALVIGLLTVIPAFAGLWVGSILGERLNASTFPMMVKTVLAASAIVPIWNGITQLWGA